MPPPTTCWSPVQTSPVSTQCQSFQATLRAKWLFGRLWLRSRIRAHNKLSETVQLLGLFQCNLLFALYQFSNSNWHCKLKLMKVTADQCQDFWSDLFAVSSYGQGKEGQKSFGLVLACLRLRLVTCCDGHPKDWQSLATLGQNVSLNKNWCFQPTCKLTGFSPQFQFAGFFPLEISFRPYSLTLGSRPSASYGHYGSWMCQWPRSTWSTHLFGGFATLQPTVVSWCCFAWGKHMSSVDLSVQSITGAKGERLRACQWLAPTLQFWVVGKWWRNNH